MPNTIKCVSVSKHEAIETLGVIHPSLWGALATEQYLFSQHGWWYDTDLHVWWVWLRPLTFAARTRRKWNDFFSISEGHWPGICLSLFFIVFFWVVAAVYDTTYLLSFGIRCFFRPRYTPRLSTFASCHLVRLCDFGTSGGLGMPYRILVDVDWAWLIVDGCCSPLFEVYSGRLPLIDVLWCWLVLIEVVWCWLRLVDVACICLLLFEII